MFRQYQVSEDYLLSARLYLNSNDNERHFYTKKTVKKL